MSNLNKRPKPGETLEDLIELQKEYMQANVKPAATVFRVNPPKPGIGDDNTLGSIKNENLMSAQRKATEGGGGSFCFTGCVIEQNVIPRIVNSSTSKPAVGHSQNSERISKFRWEYERMKSHEHEIKIQNPSSEVMKKIQKNYDEFDPFKKGIEKQEDTSVGEKLHPLLTGFSEADILKARESLLINMKPETKEILARRRAAPVKAENSSNNITTEDTQPSITNAMLTQEQESTEEEDFQKIRAESKNVLHMGKVELEKLEWTKSVKVKLSHNGAENVDSKQEDRMARFALNGTLMTKEEETKQDTWDRALHNHGDEMERPGYTMEDLFMLSRSKFSQQRTLCMNVLAEIFKRSHNGEFDFSLDLSIFQTCNELDCIYVLRTAIDHRESASLNASINCLASLLFHDQEELCLDIVFNWPNCEPYPWLAITSESSIPLKKTTSENVSTDEEMNDSDLKDFQYIKEDLIRFLINRTDIITRFKYILTDMSQFLNEVGVQGILKVLIRIARHSPDQIIECEELMKHIQEKFITPNWSLHGKRPSNMTGVPLSLALKLFRILVTSSSRNARILCDEFYPFQSIMSYLAYDQWKEQNRIMNVELLILESFNLWEALLSHQYGVHEYNSFFPVMINFFHTFHRRDTFGSFDLTIAARLHSLLGKFLKVLNTSNSHSQYSWIKEAIGFVSSFVVKMLTLLGSESTAALLDHDLCLLAILTGLECLSLAGFYEKFTNVDAALKKFIRSLAYSKVTKCFMTNSLLLFHLQEPSSDIEKEKEKYPSNVTTCGTILFGGFQVPILNKGSPFAFMTALLRYLNRVYEEKEMLKESLLDTNCKQYLTALSSNKIIPIRNNAFLRFELYSIFELLKLLPLSERVAPIYKILPHVQLGDEPLAEELVQNLVKCSSIPYYEVMTTFYIKCVVIRNRNFNLYNFKKFDGKVVSRDWIVAPINIYYIMYLNVNDVKRHEAEGIQIDAVETTLEFLNFFLKNFDQVIISNIMDIPNLYARIVLVFMLGDRIFLETKIRQQLTTLLKLLLSSKFCNKSSKKPLFSKYKKLEAFPGVFSSLYSKILVEFAANSFGDEVFGAYLMLPLRTSEDADLKSLFWNDQSIQFLRTSIEGSTIPLEYFTAVPESDPEILCLFDNAIHSKRITAEKNPLLHAICKFHLTHANQLQKEDCAVAASSGFIET